MKKSITPKNISYFVTFLILFTFMLVTINITAQEENSIEALWSVSGSLGFMDYEGDEELKDGFISTIRLGYDYSEWWTFEGSLNIAPNLKENFIGQTTLNSDGTTTHRMVSQLDPDGTRGIDSTYAMGLAIDALFHFTRWERLDPYLSVGSGFVWYGDAPKDHSLDPSIRAGGGVMYHFNDEWAVRADARTFFAGKDTEANAIIDFGVTWTWGAHLPPNFIASGNPADSDGDGLTDAEEDEIGTDPYDPDTDKDDLSDGSEVNTYKTDPLNPDTDWDGLKDGIEVIKHKTDPLKRDTDNGGVADGHEVIEDHTNPLDPSDDLMLYELNIQFDYNKSDIKPDFYSKLDVIGKVLKRNKEARARIEGHADKTRKSSAGYNKRLSKRRAKAVLKYLTNSAKIEKKRMTAKGYGFSRPKAPNDPETGNPENRRVEIYIRGAGTNNATNEIDTDESPISPDIK